jgi:glycerophosphoryl diester phosphodiesterase
VRCLTIAHRGASADAPENTLEAFALAVEHGADMIETDLHLTRDGVIVLHHDFSVRQRWIGELTLADLRARQPAVPTLEAALDAFGRRVAFNLELKSEPRHRYPGLEVRVLDAVRRRRLMRRTLFSCFDGAVLSRLRAAAPDARIGLLVSSPLRIAQRARRVGAEAVHLPRRVATRRRIAALRDAGWRVYVFTVDDPGELAHLVAWGADGIFTNVPTRLRSLLDGRAPRP